MNMQLNLPKMITFWVAVGIAVVSVVVYLVHLFSGSIPYLGAVGYALLLVAFVLVCLGLTVKGL
jgi:hypothetical protein